MPLTQGGATPAHSNAVLNGNDPLFAAASGSARGLLGIVPVAVRTPARSENDPPSTAETQGSWEVRRQRRIERESSPSFRSGWLGGNVYG